MDGIGLGSLPAWLREKLASLGPSVAEQMAQESARFRADVTAGGSGLPPAYSPEAERAFGLAGTFDFTGPIGLGVPMFAAMTGARKSRGLAEKLARWADEMGLQVDRSRSGLSSSQYLDVSKVDDAGNAVSRKIRISDHDLPPSYGQLHGYADYEIGPHGSAAGGGVTDAVAWLAGQFGVEPPKALKGRVERAAANRAAAAPAVPAMVSGEAAVKLLEQAVSADPGLRAKVLAAVAAPGLEGYRQQVLPLAQQIGVHPHELQSWARSLEP